MPKVKTGWKRVHTTAKSGSLAHYKEILYYDSGAVTDTYLSEFGDGVADTSPQIPRPPAGVDWTVMVISNNTLSVAAGLDLYGAEKSGGTFALLDADVVTIAVGTGSAASAGTYTQQPGLTPSGGRTPVFKFFSDDGGTSTSIGALKSQEFHLMWIIP